MGVANTKALSKRRGTKSVQPSAQAVACRSSTNEESVCFDQSKVITVLLSMLHGLSCNMLSQDAWYLSMIQARNVAMKNGISEADFMAIQEKIFEVQQAGKKSNPMNCMF